MRMWMTDPRLMCRKHLLGEHVEHHMFVGTILRGTSLDGYVNTGLAEPYRLRERHDQLVAEMDRRGYNHQSPLDEHEYNGPPGRVDYLRSLREMRERCPDCAALQDKAIRRSLSPSKARDYEHCGVMWARAQAGERVPEVRDPEFEIRCQHGSAWHQLIEKWLEAGEFDRQGLIANWKATYRKFIGGWIRHELAQQLERKAYPFLTNFHKKMVEVGLNRPPMLTEERLKMALEAGWDITGRLDAAWQHGEPTPENGGGIVEVVDWKSGRGAKSEDTLRKDWQLRTYALLTMNRYGIDRVLATIHYVMANKRVSVMFTRKEIESSVLLRYSRIADRIDRHDHKPANDERCLECPFALAGRACPGAPVAASPPQESAAAK